MGDLMGWFLLIGVLVVVYHKDISEAIRGIRKAFKD